MSQHATKLTEAARAARKEAVLIAPFIKADPLHAIIVELPAAVATVIVVARWIPIEIAAGVCDLEIFDVVRARPNARLYVHPLLHAKLYRFDETAFFGSANITRKALGLAAPSNLEVLLSPAESLAELKTFEAQLLATAIEVTEAYRDTMAKQVAALAGQVIPTENIMMADTHEAPATWLPTCSAPDRLWNIYSNHETWRMVESAAEAGRVDLAALGLPSGLTADLFRHNVAAVLGRMPLIKRIDDGAQKGLTVDTAVALLNAEVPSGDLPYPPQETWEVLQKWLVHFFPGRYRSHAVGEMFIQGRVIG